MSIQFSTHESEPFYEMPSQPKEVEEALGLAWQADGCLERKETSQAIELYKQALEKNLLNVWCMEQLSQIYMDRGDFSSAEDLWRRAGERLTSRRWFYLAKMAELYEARGNLQWAKNRLEEAQEFEPENPFITETINRIAIWSVMLAVVRERLIQRIRLGTAAPIPLKQEDGEDSHFVVKVEEGEPLLTADGRLIMVVRIPKTGDIADEDIASLKGCQIALMREGVVLSTATIEDVNHIDLGKDAVIPLHLLNEDERKSLEEAKFIRLRADDFIFKLLYSPEQ